MNSLEVKVVMNCGPSTALASVEDGHVVLGLFWIGGIVIRLGSDSQLR